MNLFRRKKKPVIMIGGFSEQNAGFALGNSDLAWANLARSRARASGAAAVPEQRPLRTAVVARKEREARDRIRAAILVAEHRQRQVAVLASATRWLGLIELFVPRRLSREEIGDALEVIHALVTTSAPGWHSRVTIKVISTTFWVVVNAVRHARGAVSRGEQSAKD